MPGPLTRHKPRLVQDLVEARRAAGLSQRDLAEAMQVHDTVIARWETGRHAPNLTSLQRWAYTLGYDLALARRADR